MIEVVGVSFKKNSKIYYFSPNNLKIKKGINVIVETERGLQFGTVEIPNTEIKEEQIKSSLSTVKRIASKKDFANNINNLKEEKKVKFLLIK